MRGIVRSAGYVPHRRLDRAAITAFLGTGGGKGTRAVASHDEDTTTMGVEAARFARSARAAGTGPPDTAVDSLYFATATPAYLDKTNAAALHAALRLGARTGAYDMGGSLRSGVVALRCALGAASGSAWVVLSDMRDGLAGSADEASGGDGAATFLVGDEPELSGDGAPVIAEYIGSSSVTEEFLDRWRTPGETRSRVWEEKFGETRYLDAGLRAWEAGLDDSGLDAGDIARVGVTGMHARAVRALTSKLGVAAEVIADDFTGSLGQCGAAHPGIVLASMLETAGAGEYLALLHLADGADVFFFRTTEAIDAWKACRPVARTIASQVDGGAPISYSRFLSWRGLLGIDPPRRPEPSRVSSSAAWRSNAWKYGFAGSEDRSTHAVHLPPSRASMEGGAIDDMEPAPRAEARGTIVTFTVDRVAYSPSPPIVFAVVDFDGGGRFPVELTDVEADDVSIGMRVEMTFRKLFTADGIHNYFWKARPIRGGS